MNREGGYGCKGRHVDDDLSGRGATTEPDTGQQGAQDGTKAADADAGARSGAADALRIIGSRDPIECAYKQWLRVYMRSKMIKHNKDVFECVGDTFRLLEKLHLY
jgi:hypothetical protein